MADIVASVLAELKNKARVLASTTNSACNCLSRKIFCRLADSKYAEDFTPKGDLYRGVGTRIIGLIQSECL